MQKIEFKKVDFPDEIIPITIIPFQYSLNDFYFFISLYIDNMKKKNKLIKKINK